MYSTQMKFLVACAMALGLAACDSGTTRPTDSGTPDGGGGGAVCGNGTCEAGETAANCAADCSGGAVCGNGTCEAGETTANCAADCPTSAMCGNGTCEAGETAASCAADCASGPACDTPGIECQTPDTTDNDCIACALAGPCSDQAATCAANPECLPLNDCFGACTPGDMACITECQNMFPGGAGDLNALVICAICEICPVSCDGPGSGCP